MEYDSAHPELLPPKGAYVNIQTELMRSFAKYLWRKICLCAPCEERETEGQLDTSYIFVDDRLAREPSSSLSREDAL